MTTKFWTITSEHTTHTNDRSTRFVTKQVAIDAAAYRLANTPDTKGVIILEAIALVRRTAAPVEVLPIEDETH